MEAALWKRAKLWAHKKFIEENARRIERMAKAPGIIYEIGEPTKYEEVLEKKTHPHQKVRAPQPSLEPTTPTPDSQTTIPPTMASLMQGQPPVDGSTLAQIRPLDRRQLADTMQRGQEVFGPMDRVFTANKGGLASLQRKPRQMVH